jgi:hypothetical protein
MRYFVLLKQNMMRPPRRQRRSAVTVIDDKTHAPVAEPTDASGDIDPNPV